MTYECSPCTPPSTIAELVLFSNLDQLSTVHHRAKDSQASRTNILTAVLDIRNNECVFGDTQSDHESVCSYIYIMYLSSLIHNNNSFMVKINYQLWDECG